MISIFNLQWLDVSLKYIKESFYVFFFIYCQCGSTPMKLGVQINLNLKLNIEKNTWLKYFWLQ